MPRMTKSSQSADSLYVHIPFCEHICGYCDFTKLFYKEEWASSYLEALLGELNSKDPRKFSTIYVGGGTPSALSESLLTRLLDALSPLLKDGGEFTLEGNPESLSGAKLAIMREWGVNRLSIGVQSSSQHLLSLMGRKHTFIEAQEAVERAKKAGFSSINCDLIYGLPGESLIEAKKDAEAFVSLNTKHLSAYCLSVNKGSEFFVKGYKEMGEDEAADQYEAILKIFREAGFDRYEVSNFAKGGAKCRHNLTYWRDEEYMAVGLGASGYEGNRRYVNTKSLPKYLSGHYLESEETVGPKDDLEYFFLTNLRLEEGFLLQTFSSRFGFSFAERYKKSVSLLLSQGLLVIDEKRVKATDKGLLLLDKILLSLY